MLRALLMIAILMPVALAAESAELDAESTRWARRALLHPEVRTHLQLEVAETAGLHTATRVGDAMLLGTQAGTLLALFDGRRCVGWHAVSAEGQLRVHLLRVDGTDLVAVDDQLATRTLRTLLRPGPTWLTYAPYVAAAVDELGGARVVRRSQTALALDDDAVLVTVTARDWIGDEALPDSRRETRVRLLPDAPPVTETVATPGVADLLRNARRLEREGLADAALTLAQEARDLARTTGLPDDDARLLDAQGLVRRLKARRSTIQR